MIVYHDRHFGEKARHYIGNPFEYSLSRALITCRVFQCVSFPPFAQAKAAYKLSDVGVIVFGSESGEECFILFLKDGVVRIRRPYVYTTGSSGESFGTGFSHILGTGILMLVATVTHKGEGEFQVAFFSSFHQHAEALRRFGL